MTESKNTYLPEQGEIDRTKIKGYSLRIGAFTSWVKENGYDGFSERQRNYLKGLPLRFIRERRPFP